MLEFIRDSKKSKLSAELRSLAAGASLQALGAAGKVQVGLSAKRLLLAKDSISVQFIANGNVNILLGELRSRGLQQESVANQVISGLVPLSALAELEGISSLRSARPTVLPFTRPQPQAGPFDNPLVVSVGAIDTEGDLAQGSQQARNQFGVDGSGVKVGVLSDSFNFRQEYDLDIATGDLPAGIEVIRDLTPEDSSPLSRARTDEGRAMLQIVHDIAPGSSLAFRTAALGPVDFADGIRELASIGANVIVDDIYYANQPFFQDGVIAQAVDQVTGSGAVSYFSAAGNFGSNSYQSMYRPSTTVDEFQYHDFNPGPRIDLFQAIPLVKGAAFGLSFQWDQPFASASTTGVGSQSDLDIFLYSRPILDDRFLVAASTDNNIDNDAVELLEFSPSRDGIYYLAVGQYLDAGGPPPSLIKHIYDGSAGPIEYATDSSTSIGHPIARGGLGVAAANFRETPAFGVTPPRPEPFTSLGGTPILFDTEGNRLPGPIIRSQPGITAPDAVSTTVPGFNPFKGTSAAAPSAAAGAALILEAVPGATNRQIYQAFQNTAIDMGVAGFDLLTGAGLIQVDEAIASLIGDASPTPVSSVSLNISQQFVREDSGTKLVCTFIRSGDFSEPISVQYAVSGTVSLVDSPDIQIVGDDSSDALRTIVIGQNTESASIEIEILPDTLVEGNEVLSIQLEPGNGYAIGTPDAVSAVILDDDLPSPIPGRPGRPSFPGRPRFPGRPERPVFRPAFSDRMAGSLAGYANASTVPLLNSQIGAGSAFVLESPFNLDFIPDFV